MSSRWKQWGWLGAGLLGLQLAACVPQAELDTPSDFVVLEDQWAYDFRATTVDGFVLAVRTIEKGEGQGNVEFWSKAIENTLKPQGYALLASENVESKDGLPGKKMRFGLDLELETHVYVAAVFVAEKKLYVIEAGGTEDQFKAHQAAVDRAIERFDAP